eukprot:scpid48550/ scgid1502/ Tyrosine-protein kinase receptor TYRO3; Tyrosine-protein kinase DTK
MSRQREDSGHKMYGGPGGCSVRSVLLVSLMAANCAVGVDIRLAQTFVSRYLPGVSDREIYLLENGSRTAESTRPDGILDFLPGHDTIKLEWNRGGMESVRYKLAVQVKNSSIVWEAMPSIAPYGCLVDSNFTALDVNLACATNIAGFTDIRLLISFNVVTLNRTVPPDPFICYKTWNSAMMLASRSIQIDLVFVKQCSGSTAPKNKDRKKTGTAVNIPTVATIVFTVVGVFILGFLFTVSFYCVQISKKIPASNTSEPSTQVAGEVGNVAYPDENPPGESDDDTWSASSLFSCPVPVDRQSPRLATTSPLPKLARHVSDRNARSIPSTLRTLTRTPPEPLQPPASGLSMRRMQSTLHAPSRPAFGLNASHTPSPPGAHLEPGFYLPKHTDTHAPLCAATSVDCSTHSMPGIGYGHGLSASRLLSSTQSTVTHPPNPRASVAPGRGPTASSADVHLRPVELLLSRTTHGIQHLRRGSADHSRDHTRDTHVRGHEWDTHVRDHEWDPHVRDHTRDRHVRYHSRDPHVRDHEWNSHVRDHTRDPHVRDHARDRLVRDHEWDSHVRDHTRDPHVRDHARDRLVRDPHERDHECDYATAGHARRSSAAPAMGRHPLPAPLEKVQHLTWMEKWKGNFDQGLLGNARDLIKGRRLGNGAFGSVHAGIYRRLGRPEQNVAFKQPLLTFSGDSEDECRHKKNSQEELLREAFIMQGLFHPRVVRLVAVIIEDSISLIMPLYKNGDLQTFLEKLRRSCDNQTISTHKLVRFSIDIAEGMEYLHSQRILHRDLAPRNCLLDAEYNGVISDLGHARRMADGEDGYLVNTQVKLPLRSMAPQVSSTTRYTRSSDVWSYGTTVWSIFTLGRMPYGSDCSNREVRRILHQRRRLKAPLSAPPGITSILEECFRESRSITFTYLLEQLRLVLPNVSCTEQYEVQLPPGNPTVASPEHPSMPYSLSPSVDGSEKPAGSEPARSSGSSERDEPDFFQPASSSSVESPHSVQHARQASPVPPEQIDKHQPASSTEPTPTEPQDIGQPDTLPCRNNAYVNMSTERTPSLDCTETAAGVQRMHTSQHGHAESPNSSVPARDDCPDESASRHYSTPTGHKTDTAPHNHPAAGHPQAAEHPYAETPAGSGEDPVRNEDPNHAPIQNRRRKMPKLLSPQRNQP